MLSYKEFLVKLDEAAKVAKESYHYFHVTHPETGKSINLSGLHKIKGKVVTGFHEDGKVAMYGKDHTVLHKLISDHLEKKGIKANITHKGSNPHS